MIKYDNCPDRNWYHSEDRYSSVLNILNKFKDNYSIDFAMDVLKGKYGFICQYELKLNFDTLYSFIAELNNLKIFRAEGNPGKTKYKEDTRLAWGIKKDRI